MINDLTVQHELWDRTKILEKLRKVGVPCAKSFVVYRGELKNSANRLFTQDYIEAQYSATKDKGAEYIETAKNLENEEAKQSQPETSLIKINQLSVKGAKMRSETIELDKEDHSELFDAPNLSKI